MLFGLFWSQLTRHSDLRVVSQVHTRVTPWVKCHDFGHLSMSQQFVFVSQRSKEELVIKMIPRKRNACEPTMALLAFLARSAQRVLL